MGRSSVLGDYFSQGYQSVPHIIPGVLYPAVAGKDINGNTLSSYTYGTAHSDGRKYYYTDIKGSKPIRDPRIGAHFGSQRHKTKSIQLLEQETAIHGKNVYSIDGREWMRFCGDDIEEFNTTYGQSFFFNGNGTDTDFIEITGYLSDLNYLLFTGSGRTIRYTLDGATEVGTDFGNASVTTPLSNRYVDAASLVNLGIGATLGIHTVKLRSNDINIPFYGIELIAQDTSNRSNIQIPSQNVVSYGKKFTVSGTPHYNPFAYAENGTTAVGIPNGTTNGGSVSGGWASGGSSTADYFDSTLDVDSSLGLSAWELNSRFYRPINGGRIVKWVDSSGSIKTSVNMMPPSAKAVGSHSGSANATGTDFTSTYLPVFSSGDPDHSQAEVAKTWHWREFGNGNANGGTTGTYKDASMLATTASDIAYVMDDGLTSFSADDIRVWANLDGDPTLGGDKSAYFTFIGTGLTLKKTLNQGTTANAIDDGTYAQNLFYGTHVCQYTRDDSSGDTIKIDGVTVYTDSSTNGYLGSKEWTIHQPKKPPIPEDAVVLADYMLMADFVPQTSAGIDKISKGVRFGSASRDVLYDKTAGIQQTTPFVPDPTNSHFGDSYWLGNSSGMVGTRKIVCFGDSFVVTWRQTNNEVPESFVINAGADGTTDLTNYTRASNSAGSSGAVATNGTVTRNNGTSVGSYMTAVAGASALLGVQTIKATSTHSSSGKYEYAIQVGIHTPIHTSSHYQSFETPLLHELIGGDRNMEQTNLVVSPDGKTWDEVTRDTSYLGNLVVCASRDGGNVTSATFIPDIIRGVHSSQSNGSINNGVQKYFAIAYDRYICLEDGQYEITSNKYSNGQDTSFYLLKNLASGTTSANVIAWQRCDSPDESLSLTASIYLKRGDFIAEYCSGGAFYATEGHYNQLYIKKLS